MRRKTSYKRICFCYILGNITSVCVSKYTSYLFMSGWGGTKMPKQSRVLKVAAVKWKQVIYTNLENCDTASSLRSSSRVCLQSRSDRQVLLLSLLVPHKVAQTLDQLPGRGGRGRRARGAADWQPPGANHRAQRAPAAGSWTQSQPPKSRLSTTIAWTATKSICCSFSHSH